jgi:protein associated with RNAse G/E
MYNTPVPRISQAAGTVFLKDYQYSQKMDAGIPKNVNILTHFAEKKSCNRGTFLL